MPRGMYKRKNQEAVDIRRTPLDTIEQAIADLDRQLAAKQQEMRVSERLKDALIAARDKAVVMLETGRIKLLPVAEEPDGSTKNVGFLGAGLAARSAEIITSNGSPMHVKAIHAQMRLQSGLESVSVESLRATMNSDAKRARPRLLALGDGMYGLYGVHGSNGLKRRKALRAA